ncbi:unnamed protein product [Rhizophagus irregularis]|nr:unnamed protein product [Rhizophagus irregularis]CAB5354740.1 unnamed protein product [Rhizophagus irregularis]
MEQTLVIDSDISAGDKPFEVHEFLEALGLLDKEASPDFRYEIDDVDMSDDDSDDDQGITISGLGSAILSLFNEKRDRGSQYSPS